MSSRTNGHVLTNGSLRVSQTDAVHVALRTVVRNLLSVDDSIGIPPIEALRAGRKAEVRRVAQTLA